MNELIPLFKTFGVSISILIVFTYFMLRHYWPYWKAKDQAREADRQAVLSRMMAFQEVSLKEMTEALRANTRSSEKVAEHLEELSNVRRR